MTARFQVTPSMLYDAQRDVMRQIPWMRWGGVFVIVVFPLFMIGMSLAYGGTARGALAQNGGLIIGLPVFWLVGIPLLMRWTAKRTLRSTPAFQGNLVYEFSDSGLQLKSEVSESHLTWSALTRVVETRGFFLLFQNKAMALFVPKSALDASSSEGELRAMIGRHLGERARLTSHTTAPAT